MKTMKTKKKFDCLRMKESVQAQLRGQWRGLTRAQIREEMSRFLANSDNSVAVWWRSLDTCKSAPSFTAPRKPPLVKMAKQKKEFDCLKMKREIQAKLTQRWKGLSTEEIMEQIRKDVAESTDPLMVKWRSSPPAAERQAEGAKTKQVTKKKFS